MVQVRTPGHALLPAPPHALWIPAGLSFAIDAMAPLWTARFVADSCPDAWCRVAQPPFDEVVGPMLSHLHRYPDRTWAPQLLSAVVEHLHEAFIVDAVPVRFPTDPRAREVADAIATDPSTTWELVDWAPSVGASERTLRRLFVEETGLSFTKWRLRLRTHAATRLLRDGVPIPEVVSRCGYRSAQAFARALRSELGVTPSQLAERRDRSSMSAGAWPPRRAAWPPATTPSPETQLRAVAESITEGQMAGWRGRGALLIGAGLLMLAACGDGDAGGDTSAGSTSFVDALGRTVDVPVAPQRIVGLDGYGVDDALLSLGAPVVGITRRDDAAYENAAFYEGGEDLPRVGAPWELDVEAILALEPDLIIGDAWGGELFLDEAVVASLEQIAPTVFLDASLSLDEHMTRLGELVGLEQIVDEERARTDEALAELAAARAEGELSFAVLGYFEPSLYVTSPVSQVPSELALIEAGLLPPKVTAGSTEPSVELSAERLLEAEADIIFYYEEHGITDHPLWPEHPAVEAGQAYPLSFDIGEGASYASLRRHIDVFLPIIGGADTGVIDESAA